MKTKEEKIEIRYARLMGMVERNEITEDDAQDIIEAYITRLNSKAAASNDSAMFNNIVKSHFNRKDKNAKIESDNISPLDDDVYYQMDMENLIMAKSMTNDIIEILLNLTCREFCYVIEYFVYDLTLYQMGKNHNLSADRIRQVIARALRKLRGKCYKKYLCECLDVLDHTNYRIDQSCKFIHAYDNYDQILSDRMYKRDLKEFDNIRLGIIDLLNNRDAVEARKKQKSIPVYIKEYKNNIDRSIEKYKRLKSTTIGFYIDIIKTYIDDLYKLGDIDKMCEIFDVLKSSIESKNIDNAVSLSDTLYDKYKCNFKRYKVADLPLKYFKELLNHPIYIRTTAGNDEIPAIFYNISIKEFFENEFDKVLYFQYNTLYLKQLKSLIKNDSYAYINESIPDSISYVQIKENLEKIKAEEENRKRRIQAQEELKTLIMSRRREMQVNDYYSLLELLKSNKSEINCHNIITMVKYRATLGLGNSAIYYNNDEYCRFITSMSIYTNSLCRGVLKDCIDDSVFIGYSLNTLDSSMPDYSLYTLYMRYLNKQFELPRLKNEFRLLFDILDILREIGYSIKCQ